MPGSLVGQENTALGRETRHLPGTASVLMWLGRRRCSVHGPYRAMFSQLAGSSPSNVEPGARRANQSQIPPWADLRWIRAGSGIVMKEHRGVVSGWGGKAGFTMVTVTIILVTIGPTWLVDSSDPSRGSLVQMNSLRRECSRLKWHLKCLKSATNALSMT